MPLTYTRPVGDLRIGIFTIAEKWHKYLNAGVSFQTEDYLATKYPTAITNDNLYINGATCPSKGILNAIKSLKLEEGIRCGENLIAIRTAGEGTDDVTGIKFKEIDRCFNLIENLWSIYKLNAAEIKFDFELLKSLGKSAEIDDPHTVVYGKENIFIEAGAKIKAAVINAEDGPVYIGKNAEVQEGSVIRGSFALCEGAVVNMGAKMRGDTTVGPFSKVGGEVSNSVIQGYSNKGHDGFLGNSVLGEWCNLGADTNTSNLKNNYADVKLWSYSKQRFVNTGETFCGLIMGDHSKCGINTMFNTGTVVGVSANIFGSGFPRNFIPSFAWGGQAGFSTYKIDKVFEVAEKVMERRKKILNDVEKDILKHIYDISGDQRFWEKK